MRTFLTLLCLTLPWVSQSQGSSQGNSKDLSPFSKLSARIQSAAKSQGLAIKQPDFDSVPKVVGVPSSGGSSSAAPTPTVTPIPPAVKPIQPAPVAAPVPAPVVKVEPAPAPVVKVEPAPVPAPKPAPVAAPKPVVQPLSAPSQAPSIAQAAPAPAPALLSAPAPKTLSAPAPAPLPSLDLVAQDSKSFFLDDPEDFSGHFSGRPMNAGGFIRQEDLAQAMGRALKEFLAEQRSGSSSSSANPFGSPSRRSGLLQSPTRVRPLAPVDSVPQDLKQKIDDIFEKMGNIDQVIEKIEALESGQHIVTQALNNQKKRDQKLQESVQEANKNIQGLKAHQEEFSDLLSKNNTKLEGLDEYIRNAIENYFGKVLEGQDKSAKEMFLMKEGVSGLGESVGSLQGDISEIKKSLEPMGEEVKGVLGQIQNMGGQVQKVDEGVQTLASQILDHHKNNGDEFDSLKKANGEIREEIQGIQQVAQQLQEGVRGIQQSVTDFLGNQETLAESFINIQKKNDEFQDSFEEFKKISDQKNTQIQENLEGFKRDVGDRLNHLEEKTNHLTQQNDHLVQQTNRLAQQNEEILTLLKTLVSRPIPAPALPATDHGEILREIRQNQDEDLKNQGIIMERLGHLEVHGQNLSEELSAFKIHGTEKRATVSSQRGLVVMGDFNFAQPPFGINQNIQQEEGAPPNSRTRTRYNPEKQYNIFQKIARYIADKIYVLAQIPSYAPGPRSDEYDGNLFS